MNEPPNHHPRLRPVEGFPVQTDGRTMVALHDPTGLAEKDILLSPHAYLIAALMDGTRDLDAIRQSFLEQSGQILPPQQLADLITELNQSLYLEGPEFEAHYEKLASAYRIGTERDCKALSGAGLDQNETAAEMFARMFPGPVQIDPHADRIRGLIAPHLDYRRGWDCYAQAYSRLRGIDDIGRVIILGTNHFGRAASVVATDKTFVSPLGSTEVDRGFLHRLSQSCGTDLCAQEFDHLREHSVELQVLILQALLGADTFRIVPVLCPDPCGPTGTASCNGEGPDLRDFAEHLRAALTDDDTRTIFIAGADLSHVGRRFGDPRDLDAMFLHEVSERDQRALIAVRQNDAEGFRRAVADAENPTRICSAGCIYALLTALPETEAKLLRYDQANTPEQQTCVTCSAFVFTDRVRA